MSARARSYNTEGVILRRRNLGEADSIFTVFSPREGKFDAIAKGVRKPRSHMRGHLEPLTRSQLQLAQGRNLDVFTQAETIAAYRGVRDDLDRLTLALYCCELVDRFTAERAAQPRLYDLLNETLEGLDAQAPLTVGRSFELQILAQCGFELQLSNCAICAGPIPEQDTLFSAAAGGLVCDGCRGKAETGRILSVRAIKVLRFGRTATIGQFAGLRLEESLESELQRALADAIRLVLDRETNSGRYLDALSRPLREAKRAAPGHVQSSTPPSI
jgi:DNA repair protein RecO (recombination protein O)